MRATGETSATQLIRHVGEGTVPRKVPTGNAWGKVRPRVATWFPAARADGTGKSVFLPPRRSMPARRRPAQLPRRRTTRRSAGARGAARPSNPAWRVIPNGPKIRAPQLAALNAAAGAPPALPSRLASVRRDPALRAGYETPPTPRPAPGLAPPSIVSCGQQRRRRTRTCAKTCKFDRYRHI